MELYITGHSSISALGNTEAEIHEQLVCEQTGLSSVEREGLGHCNMALVSQSNKELCTKYNIVKEYSRTSLLGIACVKNLLNRFSIKRTNSLKTGFISGTSVGGIDSTENEYLQYLGNESFNEATFLNHPSGTTTEQIAVETFPFDYVNTISTACSSASNAILMAAKLIKMGLLDRAVVGGVDAISSFTVNGFTSLMIYDKDFCKPFDKDRKGLNLGEGAGYILLENKKSLEFSSNKPLAKLSGWHNASDAYHQTASSPTGEGAQIAMKGALKMAGLDAHEISYINAHGTGTPNNDLSESTAIKAVFGLKTPPFSSTKSYTGHTLAASGGIEAGFAIMAIKYKCLYPNLHFGHCIEETELQPVLHFEQVKDMRHILSNAFGFGGNNTSLIFSKI